MSTLYQLSQYMSYDNFSYEEEQWRRSDFPNKTINLFVKLLGYE